MINLSQDKLLRINGDTYILSRKTYKPAAKGIEIKTKDLTIGVQVVLKCPKKQNFSLRKILVHIHIVIEYI